MSNIKTWGGLAALSLFLTLSACSDAKQKVVKDAEDEGHALTAAPSGVGLRLMSADTAVNALVTPESSEDYERQTTGKQQFQDDIDVVDRPAQDIIRDQNVPVEKLDP